MKVDNDISGACETDIDGLARYAGAEDPRASDCLDRRIEIRPVDTLKPCKSNARTHSRKQIRQIADSIQRFAFINPILVDENGKVIAGHGRLEAAKLLGLAEVPTLRVSHLSATEKRGYALADNRLAELAGWDAEVLAIELEELRELDFDMAAIGFDLGDVDIICNKPKKTASQSAPKADRGAATPGAVSRRDDVWLLGAHQLRCGDADNDSYAAIDAVIRRWQRVAGKAARLAGAGKSFAEIEDQRASTAPADPACRQAATKQEAA